MNNWKAQQRSKFKKDIFFLGSGRAGTYPRSLLESKSPK